MENKLNKKTISDIIFIGSSLLIYYFFPANNLFQQIFATLIFLVAMPLLYKKFILKENLLSSFGLRIAPWQRGIKWIVVGVTGGLLIYFLLYKYSSVFAGYVLPQAAMQNFPRFLLYEFTIVPLFVALYELYFRGFLLFSFVKRLGINAIFFQFFVFLLLIMAQGFRPEFGPYLIFSLFAGLIAYKSESILYSFLGQYFFIFIIDVSIIKMLN